MQTFENMLQVLTCARRSEPNEAVSDAYRLMGLDTDASYDEIESAYESLITQYAGDAKRKIKLSVAKDKILEDRLQQRL